MKKLLLLLSLLLPNAHADLVATDPGVRLSITPLIGTEGGNLGAGFDIGFGIRHVALGLRYASGAEYCMMCDREPEYEKQMSVLAGVRQEFEIGVISLRSGIAQVERDTRDGSLPRIYERDGVRHFNGLGVPFQLDLTLSGRYVGLSVSLTALADSDGGSGGLMLGLPIGYLRR
jgi:hypothetical protein